MDIKFEYNIFVNAWNVKMMASLWNLTSEIPRHLVTKYPTAQWTTAPGEGYSTGNLYDMIILYPKYSCPDVVDYITNTHKRHLVAQLLGEIWGVLQIQI